jgi:alkanesulfonate monooxygenase SsuD/methylene tetrahydromethanopterin reductase-like flavin-dependent oxidoreductase (luciferase family)
MRLGVSIFNQNAADWDRYEAEERGESVGKRPQESDADIFRDELALAIEADALGFDSVWTVEHHFTPYTMVTNPLQWLTYLAGVTKRVDLGTMVTVLPWHNPVRVAEDINMLQTFLGEDRRVIAGVGRGLARREYAGMGLDQNEARGRFDESLQIVKTLLADGEITFHGEHFTLDGVHLRPQPERDLSDLLYCAAGSPATMEIIAKNDVKPLVIPNTDLATALESVRNYMRIRSEHGFGPIDTKLALWVYVSEDAAEAEESAERYMVDYTLTALRHYEMANDYLANVKGYEAYGERAKVLAKNPELFTRSIVDSHPWGTPDMVIDKLTEHAENFGTSEIACVIKYGGMPQHKAQSSLRLLAEKVLPVMKERAFGPISMSAV